MASHQSMKKKEKKRSNLKGLKKTVTSSSAGKEPACNAGDPGSIPGSGRSSGEGPGYPLQYSWASFVAQLVKNPPAMWETWVLSLDWEDPWRREWQPTPVFLPGKFQARMDRKAWQATVHGVAKSRT